MGTPVNGRLDEGRLDEVLTGLRVFLRPGQITNMRAFNCLREPIHSALYRDEVALARKAIELESNPLTTGVYFLPNPVCEDRLPDDKPWCRGSVGKDGISRRSWLLVDADPVRFGPDGQAMAGEAANVPSTDDERAAAWDVVSVAQDILHTIGLQGAVVGDSGNGWHLCYPIDLPNDDATYDRIAFFLAELEARCGNERCHIDQKPKDAPRIWKLYGTTVRKGKQSAERPWRLSQLVEWSQPNDELRQANNRAFEGLLASWRMQRDLIEQQKRRAASRQEAGRRSALERAKAYLSREEPAISGQNGHKTAFHVACVALLGFNLSRDDALLALADWNARCQPPWSEKELRHKLDDADKQPCPEGRGYLLRESKPSSGKQSSGKQTSAAGVSFDPLPGEEAQDEQDEANKERTSLDICTINDLKESGAQVSWAWPGWIQSGVLTAVAAEGGCGKCLARGTPVLMFDGTIRTVEDVRIGDRLMGPDSRPRTVLALGRGRERMYRVTPVKGMAYTVNESHVLSLKMTGLGKGSLSSRYEKNQTVNISVRDYLKQTKAFRRHANGWRAAADWPRRQVPIDPYFLGLWLGDGSKAAPSICKPDPEVPEYLSALATSLGLRLSKQAPPGKCPVWSVVGTPNVTNPLYAGLRSLGVTRRKHVPLIYKANDRETRLAVLAGLLDSDGHLSSAGFDFVSVDQQLAEDVAFLARSLGLAAYVAPCVKTCQTGASGTYFRVGISGDCSMIPTRIARKKAPPRRQKKNVLRTGIRVEPVGEDDYYGFTIDGDSLFLLGDFTVTHNTRWCADLVRRIRHGLPWPDGQEMTLPQDSTALWVVSDNHHDEMVTLTEAFGIADVVRINAWREDPYGGVSLDTAEDYRLLDRRVRLLKPALVIIDTVGNATDKNLSKQEDAKAFYQPLQVIARRNRTVILCLTHLNASGRFLGRRVLEKVRVAIKMDQPDKDDPRRSLEIIKSNSKRPAALGVTMGDCGNEYDNDPPKPPEGDENEPGQRPTRGRPKASSAAAEKWLRDWLSFGAKPVGNTRTEAEKQGFAAPVLYRARDAIGAREFEAQGRKFWELTDEL